jgi:hypothetical protein
MSTIVLRSVKGSPLTNAEVDSNFSNLNTDKLEAATTATLTNKTINLTSNTLVATSAQIAAAVTDETGTGALVFANSPTLVTPALGTPASGVVTNLTGTASININGTVGATTANTGAFTTLTTTGNVTLGDASTDTVTVNGYMGVGGGPLNYVGLRVTGSVLGNADQYGISSSVASSSGATSSFSSAVFTPTTAAASFTVANVHGLLLQNATKGAGSTITNQHGVQVNDQTQGTNNYGITSLVSSGTNKWNIYASGTAANYFAGNVGIGTTSPSAKLDVLSSGTSAETIAEFGNGNISNGLTIQTNGNLDWGFNATNRNLTFSTSQSERLRITSAGNVGIGTSTVTDKLQVQTSSSGATPVLLSLVNNTGGAVNATGVKLWMSGRADSATNRGVYLEAITTNTTNAHDLAFAISASGAAPTERMRITSDGNVGIGTSSPSRILTVNGERAQFNQSLAGISTPLQIRNGSATTNGRGGGIEFVGPSNTFGRIEGFWSGTDEQMRLFSTGSTTFSTAATERMRIDSTGNVGIGTSSPSQKLDVAGAVKSSGEMFSDGGDISITSGATSTIKTLASAFNNTETYMLTVIGRGGNNAWRLSAIVFGGDLSAANTFKITTLANSNVTAAFSGADLQLTNTGSTATLRWRLLRLA